MYDLKNSLTLLSKQNQQRGDDNKNKNSPNNHRESALREGKEFIVCVCVFSLHFIIVYVHFECKSALNEK